MSDTPILHIYGQEAFHDDAYIAGNERLRKALEGLQTFDCHNGQVQYLLNVRIDAALRGAE